MIDPEQLLSALAEVGQDGFSPELRQQILPPFPDAAFWSEQRSTRLWTSQDVDVSSVGRGMRELLLNSSSKMELATLYFRMLGSRGAPVDAIFDVFSFTLCWQALRDNFLTTRKRDAEVPNDDEDVAEEPAAFSWEQMQAMLNAALSVCNSTLLEGKTEAIDTAFDQCSAVMRLALSHKEGKSQEAKDVASTAGEILQQLMDVNCVQRPDIALQLLNKLTPGLYGCTAMPRSTDTLKPQPTVLEATMNVLENIPEAIRHLCVPIFQNALQRAPDKAPLRNQLSCACALLWKSLGGSIACQVLHFLGMLTYGGEPGMRKLGIQCMEEMAISSLEQPCDDLDQDDLQLLAGALPEEFVLGLCVQRCADVSAAVSCRAMSAIFKFSTKLLPYVDTENGAPEAPRGNSQQRGSLAVGAAAREAWSSDRLGCLAEILSGEQALLLDEDGFDEWCGEVDAAERGQGGARKGARKGAEEDGDSEEDGEEGGGGRRGAQAQERNGDQEDENGEVNAEAPVMPEEVCLFKWVARKECELAAEAAAAAAAEAITPSTEPSGPVTPRGETESGAGAIPLTPVGTEAGTGDGAEPRRTSLPAAAATAGALTGPAAAAAAAALRTPAAASAAQPPQGPLTAPHILDMLAAQACDTRAATRKSAVQLAGSTIALFQAADAPAALLREAHDRVLPLLQRLAADVSVSVRRAVLDATIALMQSPTNGRPNAAAAKGNPDASWAKVWARIVLPLVQDAEPTVFEAAISEVTLRLITPAKDINLGSAEPSQRAIENVRALRPFIAAACAEYTTHSSYLHRVMTHVVAQAKHTAGEGDGTSRKGKGSKNQVSEGDTRKFLGQVVHAYQGLLGGMAAVGALSQKERSFCWAMVSEACSAGARGASATEFMMDSFAAAWGKLDAWVALHGSSGSSGGAAGAAGGVAHVDTIEAQKERNELQTEAAAVCSALCTALQQLNDDDGALLLTQAFKRLHACQTDCLIIAPLCRLAAFLALGRKLKPQIPEGINLGRGGWQAAVHNSCQTHVITCLEHLADLPSGPVAPHTAALVDTAARAIYTCGRLCLECGALPPQSALHAIQALCMPSHLQQHAASLSPKLSPGCSMRQMGVPSVLQAHAWLALGSMSLVDEPLCRNTTPLLVAELKRNSSPAVRANAMLALSDIAAVQTMLVDVHLKEITAAVRDPHPLLRKQALSLLAGLLQKEFLKWRGPLFVQYASSSFLELLQYLLSLVDESPTVRAMADHLVSDAMIKAPALAHTHFIEVLCVLNDALEVWTALRRRGPGAGGASQAGGSQGADFAGSQGWHTAGIAVRTPGSLLGEVAGDTTGAQSRRFVIYKALLKTMQPKYKLALVEKLCEDVLGAAAEGGLPLEGCCQGVIADALGVVALPDLQISAKGVVNSEEDGGDDGGDAGGGSQAGKVSGALQARALAALRRSMLDKMVPILATLKATLEESRHELQRDTSHCLVRLYTEHKDDMEELLVTRSQLAAEIRYKAQERHKVKKETMKARNAQNGAVTVAPRTTAPAKNPPPSPWHHLNTASLPNVTPLPASKKRIPPQPTAVAGNTLGGKLATNMATGATPAPRHRVPLSPVQFQAFPQCEAGTLDETPRLDTLAPVAAGTATVGRAPPTAPKFSLNSCLKVEKK